MFSFWNLDQIQTKYAVSKNPSQTQQCHPLAKNVEFKDILIMSVSKVNITDGTIAGRRVSLTSFVFIRKSENKWCGVNSNSHNRGWEHSQSWHRSYKNHREWVQHRGKEKHWYKV